METLMAICTFSYKLVVIQTFSSLKLRSKNVIFFCDDSHLLKVSWKLVKFFHKIFKSCFSISLYKKDIVNIAQPNKWLEILGLRKTSLCFINIDDTDVWRSELSFNCSSRNLLLNFVPKFKEVIVQNLLR